MSQILNITSSRKEKEKRILTKGCKTGKYKMVENRIDMHKSQKVRSILESQVERTVRKT